MATNPMQRKSRNAFLLGALVMLIILGLVIAFLIIQIGKLKKEEKAATESVAYVYKLSADTASGQEVTGLTSIKVTSEVVPQDAYPSKTITTDPKTKKVTETPVAAPTGKFAKIDLKKGTIITQDMLTDTGDKIEPDTRLVEYSAISLPSKLNIGDFVDIRLQLPSGLDYIVLDSKEVVDANSTTIWLNISEIEILTLNNAIVEAYIMDGSKLYATTYIEPGLQQEDTVATYTVSQIIADLIRQDANITNEAKTALNNRKLDAQRDNITNILNTYEEDEKVSSVEAGVTAEIQAQAAARKKYLESLGMTD